jgi:sugar/nucleoside kinase (ribokinase family)
MTLDVLAFGELLVDWVATEPTRSLDAARTFEKAPGGAPANVAVALARLGLRAGFAGGIAPDPFGRWLKSVLRRSGVDASGAIEIEGTDTRMAFVLRSEGGDRRLAAFTRAAAADAAFGPDHAALLDVARAAVFHFGSVTLASEPSASATRVALQRARDAGCLVSFDPNVRLALWPSADAARRAIEPLLSAADVLKVSEEEAELLTGVAEPERAGMLLMERYRPVLLAITLGARGAHLRHGDRLLTHGGFEVDAIDATGAGDAFVAGLLRAAATAAAPMPTAARRRALESLSPEALDGALRDACALGALATTRMGAMAALPSLARLEAFLADV